MYNSFYFKKAISFIFISGLLLLAISSCKNRLRSEGDPVAPEVKSAYLSNLKGVWVLTNYMEYIRGTKSPSLAFSKLQGNVTLIIPAHTNTDSLVIKTSIKNHINSFFSLYLVKGNNKGLITSLQDTTNKENYYTLGYETSTTDTIACLYHYSADNKLIDTKKYTKVANNQPERAPANWGIDYAVKKLLFNGSFVVDGINDKPVILSADGKITGLMNYKTYTVLTDYTGREYAKDFIRFDNIPYEGVYRYEIADDSVKLSKGGNHIKLIKQH